MCRNRTYPRTIAHVEALEGRQLMAFDTLIHVGALTGAALVDFNRGETPASDGWREIDSFSWGVSNPTTGSGGTGKVSVSSFNIMMKVDDPSAFKLVGGQHFPEAEVVMRKAGGDHAMVLEYDFKPVSVESIQWSGSSGGDDTPTESVSFGFGKVTVDYFEPAGPQPKTPSESWDINKPSAV